MKLSRIILTILVLTLLFTYTSAFAADPTDTEAGYRMQPLRDKLAALTTDDINKNIVKYTDLTKHWCRNEISALIGVEVLSGVGGNKFMPDGVLQADQLLTMVIRGLGYKLPYGKNWTEPYIAKAKELNLITNTEIKDYTKTISRELAVKIVYLAAMLVDLAPDGKYDDYIKYKVIDYSSITNVYKQAILNSYKLGLVAGSNGKFGSKSTLTRAEGAAIVYRLLNYSKRVPMKPGASETLNILNDKNTLMDIYPGSFGLLKDEFDIAVAMKNSIPKAKGYVEVFIDRTGKGIVASMYVNKAARDNDILSSVAIFKINYSDTNTYVYSLSTYDLESYKSLFTDYVKGVLMALFEKDAEEAKVLHDKYMDMTYTRTDGLNEYEAPILNNRQTVFIRYNLNQFGIQAKLKGVRGKV